MEPAKGDGRNLPQTSLDFGNNAFALVPMMAYRAQAELQKFLNDDFKRNAEEDRRQAGDTEEAEDTEDGAEEEMNEAEKKQVRG